MIIIKRFRKHYFETLCCLPLVSFLILLTLTPVLRVFHLSIKNPSAGLTLSHFQTLFEQTDFHQALANTLIIALGSVSLEIILGLALALLLSYNSQLIKYLRAVFMLPLAIPTVVVAVMMSYLFSSSGWLNRILSDLAITDGPILWMSGGAKSLMMIVIADCWKVTPLVMLILLAGLQSIDQELYSAARVEGASGWVIFRRITLPLLLPSITTAIIIRGIDAFRIFSLVLILMGQNLKVIGTYAYLEYMEYQNVYLSAASAVVLFMMILIAVVLYLKIVGRRGLIAY